MKKFIRKHLGIEKDVNYLKHQINVLENLLLHEKSKLNGFAVLKKHLQRTDKPLPKFCGKEIKQD